MKKFLLGGLSVIALAYYGCYMYEMGRFDVAMNFWRHKK